MALLDSKLTVELDIWDRKTTDMLLQVPITFTNGDAAAPAINIGGVIVSNATLHNEDEIKRKDIRVGDTAVIERAGDVIPHILSVDIKKRLKNSKKFTFLVNCPSCGSKTIKEFNKITKKVDAMMGCVGCMSFDVAKYPIVGSSVPFRGFPTGLPDSTSQISDPLRHELAATYIPSVLRAAEWIFIATGISCVSKVLIF